MNLGQLEYLVNEIRRLSFADDKTPLGNALALAQEEQLINEGKSAYNVVVCGDLDDFKQLNDTFGYEAGDLAIKGVGETINQVVTKGLEAKAFRQSGDEFVILFKEAFVENFVSIIPSFSSITFTHYDQELRTTMSLGYARGDGKTNFQELMKRAEAACKYAKTLSDVVCIEWTEDIKSNSLVRKSGTCNKCNAKINCNVPQQNAPPELKFCPCCGESL